MKEIFKYRFFPLCGLRLKETENKQITEHVTQCNLPRQSVENTNMYFVFPFFWTSSLFTVLKYYTLYLYRVGKRSTHHDRIENLQNWPLPILYYVLYYYELFQILLSSGRLVDSWNVKNMGGWTKDSAPIFWMQALPPFSGQNYYCTQ